MSLNWNWNETIGYIELEKPLEKWKFRLYHGNALLIALAEDEERNWRMHQFFVDVEHLKNCLNDKTWNPFEGWKRVVLNKKFKLNNHTTRLINALRERNIEVIFERIKPF